MNRKLSIYSVVVEPCEEGGFFASCPIIQGCHAEGETYGEVIDNVTAVIREHLELRKINKEPMSAINFKSMKGISIDIPVLV